MNRSRGWIIAIDGPAGAGKTTAARNLARRLGYTYLDTGATFRAVALKALESGMDLAGEGIARLAEESDIRFAGGQNERVLLDGRDVTDPIRAPEVSAAASRIAAHPGVRRALMELWRAIGREGGVVLEGRDIGTVVFPDAELKFFLVAPVEVRAERRFRELENRSGVTLEQVTAELTRRDQADSTREHAPLLRAPDAIEVDTSKLDIEETADRLASEVRGRMRRQERVRG